MYSESCWELLSRSHFLFTPYEGEEVISSLVTKDAELMYNSFVTDRLTKHKIPIS